MGNTIELKLQPEQFKIIVEGLESIPYKMAAPILEDNKAQLKAKHDEMNKQKKRVSNMEEVLLWLGGGGIGAWLLKELVSILKYNGNELVSRVSTLEKIIQRLELIINEHEYKIKNLEGDNAYFKNAWEESNKGMAKVTETISLFDSNMKIWHKDLSTQNAEMKFTMDKSNQLIQETNAINKELLGFLKGLSK